MSVVPVRHSDITRGPKRGLKQTKSPIPDPIINRRDIDRSLLTTQCGICESIATFLWPPCDWSKLASVINMPFFFGSTCATHVEFIREVLGDRTLGPANPNLAWSINWRMEHRGEYTNTSWIDPGLPSRWKEKCEKHCDCSKSQFHLSLLPSNPSWFIDTKQNCLVPARRDMSYITLSYVWGDAQQYLTTRAAIEQLRQPGALCNDALGITQTIKDAMKITTLLKEQYLWVDTLCIVQDDETTKRVALENMSSIYANSAVTIVAADGPDANYGLRGIWKASLRPRNVVLRTFSLAPNRTVITLRSFRDYEGPASWHGRAWTFQEAIFSRRLLVFYKDGLHWECISSAPKHDSLSLRNLGNAKIGAHSFVEGNLSDLSEFARLVDEYNRRKLSFPEDVLQAFAGIATALRTTKFPGGFRSGLPVDFFDIGLLWNSYGTLTRRVRSKAGDNSPLPSWSWAGWSGSLDLSSWHMAMEYIEPFRNYGMFAVDGSLVQWKTHQTLGDEGIPIKSINFSASGAPGVELLPPWRYQYLGRGVYRFPIPRSEDNIAETSYQARFLSCGCNGARLLLAEPVMNITHASDRFSPTNFHCLRDKSGAWAGILQVHEPLETGYRSQIYDFNTAEVDIERDVETGVFPLPEYFCSERKERGWRYEFYNVLYIKWDSSGVAYRKGLGRVDREIWESLKHNNINLILG
ncbi:Heterokaryon incompatibility protein (HET) domain containing protein [Hyaloscypha variabilis]